MQPGYELDKAVAEACGFTQKPECFFVAGGEHEFDETWFDSEDKRIGSNFRPSTDWNDAMLAAEKSGFLYGTLTLQEFGDCWFASSCAMPPDMNAVEGETGTHAICLAILKLKAIDEIRPAHPASRDNSSE